MLKHKKVSDILLGIVKIKLKFEVFTKEHLQINTFGGSAKSN